MKSQPGITNQLAAIRKQRGVSASSLAAQVGVSRQTIYAVEAGTYIPNTAVGLRLAHALSVDIEEIFSLSGETPRTAANPKSVTLITAGDDLQPGQSVQLCRINGKLYASPTAPSSWYLPASDAAISSTGRARGMVRVDLHEPEPDLDNRLLLAGCDPAMSIVAQHANTAGIALVLLYQNSSQSVALLNANQAHIAGTHLRKSKQSSSSAVFSFAFWQEGLITAAANPKHIKTVADLARKDVSLINRESGSGSRALLDSQLKHLGIAPKQIRGYEKTAPGHLAAAWEVKASLADCCLATEASARFFGLHFIPLETVRYDLVLRKGQLTLPLIQRLLDLLNQFVFRRKLAAIGGYDTSVTGQRIQ